MIVYADLRWNWKNGAAGIGVVKDELVRRKPGSVSLDSLRIAGRLASPVGPAAISLALRKRRTTGGVFWSPGFMPPLESQIPSIVTVHDLMHLDHYSHLHRTYYNVVLKRLFKRCDAIVCVSEFVRAQFIEWSGIDADRVHLIYNGISAQFAHSDGKRFFNFPYVLYSGNRRSYKNLGRLLAAYAASSLPATGIHLVLTGEADIELVSLARRLGITPYLRFAGRVGQGDIGRLYCNAALVALVSLSEGFGLPILEGMVSGVPVLTSNVTAMAEVGGSAALQVDPLSIDAIRGGLELLAFDSAERKARIALGKQRASFFSWDSSAAKLWSLVGTVAS